MQCLIAYFLFAFDLDCQGNGFQYFICVLLFELQDFGYDFVT